MDKKILIAEDDMNLVEIYKDFFGYKKELQGIVFVYAKNVKECEEMIEKESPGLMFLDLGLEDIEPPPGLDILKAYKDKMKIVVISGYHEYEKECLANGALAFLGKPVDYKQMVRLMQENA